MLAKSLKIFISHTTHDPRDHALAQTISLALTRLGASCWIAPESLPSGSDWQTEIDTAIRVQCSHFLVILSAASVQSDWVRGELKLARQRRESDPSFVILPLKVGDVEAYEGRDFVERFQSLPYREDRDQLLRSVLQAVGLAVAEYPHWDALMERLEEGACTPILGPGLEDSLLGSTSGYALQLSRKFNLSDVGPIAFDLPQIFQYLRFAHRETAPLDELKARLHQCTQHLPASEFAGRSLPQRLEQLAKIHRRAVADEPHGVLADLPVPLYICAGYYSFLFDALRQVKQPELAICRWRQADTVGLTHCLPTPEHPYVFHLFGHISEPDTLVMTEDDYFEHTTAIWRNKDLLPITLRRILMSSSLLFLGFHLQDWQFRLLLRMIDKIEGSESLRGRLHVAVQVDPADLGGDDAAIRETLQRYFARTPVSIDIYPGTVHSFVRDLKQRWRDRIGMSCATGGDAQ